MENAKELMHCLCGTNNRAPRWTFTDPYKPEVRPGTREQSASPAGLAAPAMNARDTTKVYVYGGLKSYGCNQKKNHMTSHRFMTFQ